MWFTRAGNYVNVSLGPGLALARGADPSFTPHIYLLQMRVAGDPSIVGGFWENHHQRQLHKGLPWRRCTCWVGFDIFLKDSPTASSSLFDSGEEFWQTRKGKLSRSLPCTRSLQIHGVMEIPIVSWVQKALQLLSAGS
jgi:hypothetical protein